MSEPADLLPLFLQHRGPGADPPGAALEAALRAALERAVAAWPELFPLGEVEPFLRHLAGLAPAQGDAAAFIAGINAPDLYLAFACLQGRPAALRRFEERYLAPLPALLTGMNLTPTLLEELRQVLRDKLLVGGAAARPRLAGYSGRGALQSWMRVAASRTAMDLLQARGEQPHQSLDTAPAGVLAAGGDADLDLLRSRYRDDFAAALRDAFASLPPEQRNLLRLHHVDGLGIDELGPMLRVHRATAARRLAAARQAVLDEIRRLLGARLGLNAAEFESLCRVIHSQLDVSMSALLPAADR